MRPFIVTELEAGKLPRWGLLALCALYVLPGFIGRDPWRTQDAAGFGIALSMMGGDAADWLMPNIANLPAPSEGPLPFWLAALLGQVVAPLVGEHGGVRLTVVALLTLALVLVWYTTYGLARRPGVQPSDPFGASASQVDYGRALADSGLLVLMATFGLIVRMHETTGEPAQIVWIAAFLFGCTLALDRPAAGAAIAGAAIAATLLSRGAGTAIALVLVLVLLPLACRDYRLVGRRMLPVAVAVALAGALPWPLALSAGSVAERAHLLDWAAWNLGSMSGPTLASLHYFARTVPWFFWPAWPVALWAAWRWRGRWGEPAVALPMLTALALALRALVTPSGAETWLLPITVPLAMLAAMGVPTLRRGIVSLIDWFAVTSFTLFGIAIWAYWIALMTGFPPRMAYRASQLAPGFTPQWIIVEIVLGGLATIAWLALVRWRVSRQPRMIWRAMALSCGGLVLAWFLLMTLWLPVFNERNTYRDVAHGLAAAFDGGEACIETRNLERAPRASFHYFARLRFAARGEQCNWLLIQDEGPTARMTPAPEPGWTPLWQGQRRSDRHERFRLYRRNADAGTPSGRDTPSGRNAPSDQHTLSARNAPSGR
ncbi:MAG: glycosyltransferase [Burkholderiaceae bacterium]|nr:glycosyltransferase [Burkholderiaceae bacterium]